MSPRLRHALCCVLIAALTVAAFARVRTAYWTWWDDPETIHHNPRLNPPTAASLRFYWTTAGANAPMGLYIPATYTAWSGLAELATLPRPDANNIRLSPEPFHAFNMLLHALSAVLVFELLRALFRRDWPVLAGALLFALHPVQVEPVGWISGGKDVLYGCLSLAALWQYVLAVRGSRSGPAGVHFTLATLLLVLAMLSKPTAVVVPLMAAVIDRLLLGRRWRAIGRSLWFWFVLMIPCAICTKLSQQAPWSATLPIWTRPAIAADALAFYVYKLIWPLHLSVDYGRRPAAVLAHGWIYYTWMVPVAIAAVTWRTRQRFPAGLAAALLMLLPLTPVLGFTPFMFQFVSTTADHYLYLAMLGPALLVAAIVSRISGGWAAGAISLWLAALGIRSSLQEPVWQNTQTLFEHALAVNPDSFIACDMLGFQHTHEGQRLGVASINAERAGRPDLATLFAQQSRREYETAVSDYQHGLEIFPQYVPSLFNLAIDAKALNRPEQARAAVDRIAGLQPILPPAFQAEPIDLARALVEFGDPAAAVPILQRWLQAHPNDMAGRQLLARATAGSVMR